ncbi:MAG: hypothetical protein ACOYLB_17465 [Phototrophicaceae bacterium]
MNRLVMGGASLLKLANGTARAYCNGEITQRHSPVAPMRPHPTAPCILEKG